MARRRSICRRLDKTDRSSESAYTLGAAPGFGSPLATCIAGRKEKISMIQNETFNGLYRGLLQDLYDTEQQMIESLPGIIHAAWSADLKTELQHHLEETKLQCRRLESLLTDVGEPAGISICSGSRALLAEGRMRMNELRSSPVLDAALIAAARQVEHFEICGYETASALAEMLDTEESARALRRSLDEEKETDAILLELMETIVAGGETAQSKSEVEDVVTRH
jgi:ferritin-like metal-binding protein YciE